MCHMHMLEKQAIIHADSLGKCEKMCQKKQNLIFNDDQQHKLVIKVITAKILQCD